MRAPWIFLISAALTAAAVRLPAPPADPMADAARKFVASLTPEQSKKARFAMEDAERVVWGFVPNVYPGLALSEMNAEQRIAAHALLRSALSPQGYLKATSIFSLDAVLREMSEKAGRPAPMRDPERYFFAVFGEPGGEKPWGWRVQGHHVSLHFTSVTRELTAHTPMFFGANPGTVRSGASTGLRVLAEEEDAARTLVKSLSDEQRKSAVLDARAPEDVILGPSRKSDFLGEPKGIAAAQLDAGQRAALAALLDVYISNLRPDLAAAERDHMLQKGASALTFAWAGGLEPGQGHYYRIQGPGFVVEYDNTQDGAGHPHTLWRDLHNDFGGDALAEHLRREHGK